MADLTLTLPYNDFDAATHLFDDCSNDIAALIIEPVVGNTNCLPPRDGYLQHLRALCTQHGALLIFDEVMTGFRVALGGAQERAMGWCRIITFGKIIGGGMPVGAYGGRRDLMQQIAPRGPIYQAGTLVAIRWQWRLGLRCWRSSKRRVSTTDWKQKRMHCVMAWKPPHTMRASPSP